MKNTRSSLKNRLFRALAGVTLFTALCLPVAAALVEEVIDVPVRVKTISAREVSQSIVVTVFRDDSRDKAPYLVLNHGRPANSAQFAKMGRQRYADNSRYFVELGFVVLVPTRAGYGESGGEVDVEYSGPCNNRNFAGVAAAMADQTVAIIKTARELPYVDLTRGMVAGQSFGGMATMALSARPLPGLLGAANFAGGGGGNPATRPGDPCSSARLTELYRSLGGQSRVPTLWLYSENDQFWGEELPREWFAAFTGAGGRGRFVPLPPYKNDGHGIFSGNPAAWKPAFEQFVREIGVFGAPANPAPPPGRSPQVAVRSDTPAARTPPRTKPARVQEDEEDDDDDD